MIEPIQLTELLETNGGKANQIAPDFSASDWLSDTRNIAIHTDDDLAMFEWIGPATYEGHIWFKSRGIKAFRRARQMLDEMKQRGAECIIGGVPHWRGDVQRFVEKLGFVKIDEADSFLGKVFAYQLIF